MKAKDIVANFYKSDVVLDTDALDVLLHDDVLLEWHSTKGFLQLNKPMILDLSKELNKAYVRSKIIFRTWLPKAILLPCAIHNM